MSEAELVSVPLPSGDTCRFSVDAVNRDSYQSTVAAGGAFDFSWQLTNTLLRPGSVFFDIGANIGSYSVPAAIRGVRVHAFEMMDENVRHLSAAMSANGVKNASIVRAAISDSAGTTGTRDASAWAYVDDKAPGTIPKLTIDDYVSTNQIKHVDVLKIDIEGSERAALKGMQRLLERDKPDIIIESNALTCGYHNYSYRELLSFLGDKGYRIFRVQSGWLSPWMTRDVQEVICADYYCTTKTNEDIARNLNWPIRSPNFFELSRSILRDAGQTDIHKLYVTTIASKLPPLVRLRFFFICLRWSRLCDENMKRTLQIGSA